MIEKGHERLQL